MLFITCLTMIKSGQKRPLNSTSSMENVTLPTVVQHLDKGNCQQYRLHIPANLIYFKGHFEQLAIVPGVTQIKWVVDFASESLGQANSTRINKLKFMRPIFPDQHITLAIELTATGCIHFSYFDNDAIYSQGQICYD